MSDKSDIGRICKEFEDAWVAGNQPEIADFASKIDEAIMPELMEALRSVEFRCRHKLWETNELKEATSDGNPTVAHDFETRPPERTPSVSIKSRVKYFGEYEIVREISRGGMGVVYKARQTKLNRIVALKMILSGEFAGSEAIQRFQSEAEAAANLDHPGIVPIYEIGEHGGQQYFSMAFIDGPSLQGKLAAGPLPAKEAAKLSRKIADAVAYAHSKNVIHRDLKPANVLIDRTGEPKITDFGLAKRVEDDRGLTHTGAVVGTPSYMPPEQACGQINRVGTSADVYSLGAILYCMLTGKPPFQAASAIETLQLVTDSEPVSPRSINPLVPQDLETICLKCLEKLPARRYSCADELVAELDRFLENKPILARPVGSFESAWRWCKRKPALAATSLGATLSLLGGITVSTLYAVEAKHQRADAITARDQAQASEIVAMQQTRAAEENLRRAESIKKSLVSALASVNPDEVGRTLSLVDVLDRTLLQLSLVFETDPLTRAELLVQFANSYQGLGAHNQMLATRKEVCNILKDHKGKVDSETIEATVKYCWSLMITGRPNDGIAILEDLSDTLSKELSPNPQDVMAVHNTLGDLYRGAGEPDKGISILTEVLKTAEEAKAPEMILASVMNNLALCYFDSKQYSEAIKCFEDSVRQMEVSVGPDHPSVLTARSLLGLTYMRSDRYDLAIAILRQTYSKQVEYLGLEHFHTLQTAHRLAEVLALRSRELKASETYPEAIESMRECLKLRETHRSEPWLLLATMSSLGELIVCHAKQLEADNKEEAQRLFTEAEALLIAAEEGLAGNKALIPESDMSVLRETVARIVHLYRSTGQTDESQKWQAKLDAMPALTDE